MSFPETALEDDLQETDVNNPSESSQGDEGEKESAFDAVQSALEVGDEASPSSTGEDNASSDDASKEPLPEEVSDEEMDAYPKNSQRRIRQLVDEKRVVSEEAESLKPKAQAADQIFGYMKENNISTSDLDSALNITRLVNSDPSAALQALTPIYQDLAKRAGAILPDDLQQQVGEGYITEAHARELATAKSQLENTNRQREAEDARRQQDSLQAMTETAKDTATDWENQKKQSDPDWHIKQSLVTSEIELELRRQGADGFPKNSQETKTLCDKALKTVEERLKSFKPTPRPLDPVVNQAPGNGSPAPEPKSSLEAISLAMGEGADY